MNTRPKPDPFAYIRDYYGVPAKKGQRVAITVDGQLRNGEISGAHNQYIRVRFDGDAKPYPGVFHPTDGVTYLGLNSVENEPVKMTQATVKAALEICDDIVAKRAKRKAEALIAGVKAAHTRDPNA